MPTTNYTYEVRDLLVGVTDAAGNQTQMDYDKLGRKTTMGDPDMGSWAYAYDNVGNMTRQTDAKGQRICLYYDSMDRLLGKIYWANDSCPTPSPWSPLNVAYTYDQVDNGRGHRTGMSDPSGSTAWTYDDRGRVTAETRVVSGTGTFFTQWSYDSLDRVTAMVYPADNANGAGERVNYTYNTRGLLNSVASSAGFVYVQFTDYDALGRVEIQWLGAHVLETDYRYYGWTEANGRGRLAGIRTASPIPASILQDLYYTYDAVGNVLTILDDLAPDAKTQHFIYDDLNRLDYAYAGGQYDPHRYSEDYGYSGANGKIGNLTSKGADGYDYGPQSSNCPYGALDKAHAVVAAGSRTFCYDPNGNQVRRSVGGSTYDLAYDSENRLTSVSGGGGTTTLVYDGDGRRVKRAVGAETTVYVGNYLEWTGSADTMVKYYYAAGRRVAMRVGSGTPQLLLSDHLGSTAVTADILTGAKIADAHYKPFGENWYESTPPVQTSYRYTGQRLEADLGLYDYGARFYDPALGRFIQADTIVPSPQQPQTLNRYSYVRNSPCRYVDPSGHCEAEHHGVSGANAACWRVYAEVLALLGPGFFSADLWTWTLPQLLDLLDWVNRGIRFEGMWGAQDMRTAVAGLNAMLNAFKGNWGVLSSLLGISTFGTLTYVMGLTAPEHGAETFGWENRVTFRSDSPIRMEVFLHETGHLIDYHLGGDTGAYWSSQGFRGLGWQPDRFLGFLWETGGWTYAPGNLGDPAPAHSWANPIEDFADTFALWVMQSEGIALPVDPGTPWNLGARNHFHVLGAALFGMGPHR